jgi:hypothetical protein
MITVRKTPAFTMERYGRLPDMDRSFDIGYWQRLGPAAIFEAAWQMAVAAHTLPPAVPMNSDFEELLRIFNGSEVRYLIVGG